MPLRKPPELTPEILKVFRENAQHSTGPRSPAAKENVKMNALKHGFYSAAENHQIAMLALGEDPQEFQALQENLLTTFGPGDELWCRQIEDLAKLYWRRSRLERMQTGFLRRALLRVEEWQERREVEMANATFEPSEPEMLDISGPEPSDLGVRLRRTLSTLGVIRALVAKTSASEACGSSQVRRQTAGPYPGRPRAQVRGPANPGRIARLAIYNYPSTFANGHWKTGGARYRTSSRPFAGAGWAGGWRAFATSSTSSRS